MEYIRKKWDEPTMEKRLNNLKKLFGDEVDKQLDWYINIADSRLDAMYLTYYALKDKHCKIRRGLFGTPKMVEFKYRKPKFDDSSWSTWTYFTPNWFNGATSATATTTTTWTTAMDYNSLYSNTIISENDYTWDVITNLNN